MSSSVVSVSGILEEIPSKFSCEETVPNDEVLLCPNNNNGENSELSLFSSPTSVLSYFDPVILHHPKVLGQLRELELTSRAPRDYFNNSNKDEILPYMRKVVAMWMLEVCEEQSCEDSVFPLGAALLDQFLGCTKIKAEELQLAACVCLLLASKTRQESHFSLQLLSWYTENSVTLKTLMSWELMILSQLNWDINIITPTDFVDFLLVRTPGCPSNTNSKEAQLIRRHAITFIALCCTEPKLVGVSPCLIAASSLYTAFKGVRKDNLNLVSTLSSLSSSSTDALLSTALTIENIISTELHGTPKNTDAKINNIHQNTNTNNKINGGNSCAQISSSLASLTPTDVQDIFC